MWPNIEAKFCSITILFCCEYKLDLWFVNVLDQWFPNFFDPRLHYQVQIFPRFPMSNLYNCTLQNSTLWSIIGTKSCDKQKSKIIYDWLRVPWKEAPTPQGAAAHTLGTTVLDSLSLVSLSRIVGLKRVILK